jgi:hypothetical protein
MEDDMSERRRNEKEEEKREKEDEKKQEKEWQEKWQHNPVRVIMLALILIWGGVVALIQTTNLVTASWWNAWAVFLIGTGVILLIKAAFRARPEHRRPVGGTIIIGLILIGVGLGNIIGWAYGWPVILIAIGVIIILFAIFRRR